MKEHFLVSFGFFVTLTCTAFAGGPETSGGGGGVLCTKNGQTTLVTLDYYQASLPRVDGTSDHLVSIDGTETDVLNRILSGLNTVPYLKQALMNDLEGIGEISRWKAATLEVYNDAGRAYVLDPNCKYVQIAIRQDDVIYGDPAVLALLPAGQRAILRLHEAIYKHSGATTSFPTRNFLAELFHLAYLAQHRDPSIRLQAFESCVGARKLVFYDCDDFNYGLGDPIAKNVDQVILNEFNMEIAPDGIRRDGKSFESVIEDSNGSQFPIYQRAIESRPYMINNVPAFIWFLNRDLQSAKLMVSTSGSCTAECKTYIANIESKIRTFYIGAIITFNGDQKKTLSYPGLKKDFNSYETSVLGEISRQFQVLQSH